LKRTLIFILLGALTLLALVPAASAMRIVGGPGDDVLTGTERRDFIHGRGGSDTLSGEGGGDFLFGGRGADTLEGGAGPDSIYAGRGADTLEGGAGADRLYAGWRDAAMDVVDCGEGRDRALIRAGDVAIDCERVRVLPPRGHRPKGKRIAGTRGDDTLVGTRGRDFIFGFAGDDALFGLGAGDFLFGGRDDDGLHGGAGADRGWGGSGNDTVRGGPGHDWLWGGAGADALSGGEGNDRLHAVADDGAADTLDCGENDGDRDRAVLRSGDTAVDCERVRTIS
jgi:Ca2+-binding RTX toxin-like protein